MDDRYKRVTIEYFNPSQIYEVYKDKYEKDYIWIGCRAKEGKATITLYPRHGGDENVQ